MTRRGYEVMRVSPQKTKKHGVEYRKVFGGIVEPDHRRPVHGKKHTYHPSVSWHHHGYVKARGNQKTGTTRLQDLRGYPIERKNLPNLLMEKPKPKRKTKSKRRRR